MELTINWGTALVISAFVIGFQILFFAVKWIIGYRMTVKNAMRLEEELLESEERIRDIFFDMEKSRRELMESAEKLNELQTKKSPLDGQQPT